MSRAIRRRALSSAALLVLAAASACTAARDPGEIPEAPRRPQSVDAEGIVPEYCPRIALREGTAILREGTGDAMEYIASITSTVRECHVVDGELRMRVGASGRVVAGPAGRSGTATLPIRVAVAGAGDVLYSNKGAAQASYGPGVTGRFVYVDEAVRVPEPTAKNYVIFVGFDEGGD